MDRMENALESRKRIGVNDAVLLSDTDSPDVFIENLRKRFKADIIYVRDFNFDTQFVQF